jgi:hypothetical protein
MDVDVSTNGAPNPGAILQNEPLSPKPVSATVELNATTMDDKKVRLSNSEKAQLRQAGWSDDDIAKMKPEEVRKILGLL